MEKVFNLILSIALITAFVFTSLGLASIPVSSIKLNTVNISLHIGNSCKLKVDIEPDSATNRNLSFSSGNKNVATVDKNGNVKAIKEGKTLITVTSLSKKGDNMYLGEMGVEPISCEDFEKPVRELSTLYPDAWKWRKPDTPNLGRVTIRKIGHFSRATFHFLSFFISLIFW